MSEYAFVTQPVVRAMCEEDAGKVRELVAGGASLEEPDGTFGPPLLAAVRDENRPMLALLLELGAHPDGPTSKHWETPLCEAALNRDIKAVELLLSKGADPNLGSPLMSAIVVNDVKIAKMLLDAGADVFGTNRHGVSPANSLDINPPGRAMVKFIHTAAEESASQAGLVDAARFGATERVRELADDAKPAELLEAAGFAVENTRADVLTALLEAGVEPNAVAPKRQTGRPAMPLLHLAVHLEQDAAIEALLTAGADPNLRATIFDEAGTTPLMMAAQRRKLARVKTLLAAGADPQERNKQGETAMALARKAGRKPIIKHLDALAAKQPAAESESADAGVSLHDAVRDGRLDVVRSLLASGAEVNDRDRQQRTPLMEAIDHDHPEMLGLLLEHGADPCVAWPNRGQSTWSVTMLQRSAAEMAELLLAAVDDPVQLAMRQTSQNDPAGELWAAVFGVRKGAGVIARLLLEHGLDPNQRFVDEFTPLMWAAVYGDAKTIDAVQVLLEAGADARRQTSRPDPVGSAPQGCRGDGKAGPGVHAGARTRRRAADRAGTGSAAQQESLHNDSRPPGAELDAHDQADAILARLKTAAAEPWFTQLAGEVAEKLECKPRPWRRRAGVMHFSAKLSRLPDPVEQSKAGDPTTASASGSSEMAELVTA